MTIRAMKRATAILALALVAISFGACGSSDDEGSDAVAEEAHELAEDATEAVEDLESRLDDVVVDLDRVDADGRDLARRFDRIHKDLRDAIANLRQSISDATSDAASARSSAESALGEIEAAVERLSVLENRFDYHLRNDH